MKSKLKGRCLLERVDVLKKFEWKKLQEKLRHFSMNGCIQRGDSFYGRIFNMNKAGPCKTGLNQKKKRII